MSRTYSEKELLLLSNFVYIPACLSDDPISSIIDSYRDEDGGFTADSVKGAAAGGGMCEEDVATVFSKMDEHIKEDPSFGQLSVSRTLDEKDVRALCYTDAKDNDPVVVFRGTGGTENAWRDNFEGAGMEDTKIQKIAGDFIKTECSMYDGIVVTGHSKGGNLAQYVTVTNEELIKECVSYDGQGFGDDFVRRYCSDIEKAAPKIKSVSAYNDFVNILLTCIAGTTVYVANDASAAGAHSPTTLLTCNSFDESGCITSVTSQGMVAKELDALTDMIVKALGPLSDREKGTLCSIAGRAVSSALCAPKGEIVNECVAPTLGLAAALAVKSLMPADPDAAIKSPAFSVTHIDTFSCLRVADDLIAQRRGIERVIAGVERVRGEIANGITTGMIAERALESVCNELSDISNMIYGTAQTVEGAARIYADAESRIMDLLRGS